MASAAAIFQRKLARAAEFHGILVVSVLEAARQDNGGRAPRRKQLGGGVLEAATLGLVRFNPSNSPPIPDIPFNRLQSPPNRTSLTDKTPRL